MFPMSQTEFLLCLPSILVSGFLIGMWVFRLIQRPVDKATDELLKTIEKYFKDEI